MESHAGAAIRACILAISCRYEDRRRMAVLVVTPWRRGIERLRHVITWQQAGRRYQGAVEQGIALG
jgi:hypothetical protein